MPEPYTRMPNGVMQRNRGEDDLFSERHRVCLPGFCYIYDQDASTGSFYCDGDTRIFHEVQYGVRRRGSLIRDIYVLAILETKAHMGLLDEEAVIIQTSHLLHICRALRDAQRPYPCRFFYVVGTLPPFLASAGPHWLWRLFILSIFCSSSCFSASRLNVAPFCIGGYSRKVWAALPISCCTKTKRQNS